MNFYAWFIELKLILNAKINYQQLTTQYLQHKRRKAAEEIKNLESFTHWPTAKAKNTIVLSKQRNVSKRQMIENNLHYLPFYSYQKRSYNFKSAVDKTASELIKIDYAKNTVNKSKL